MTLVRLGLFEISDRYLSLDSMTAPLVEIDAVESWEEFRALLERVWRKATVDQVTRGALAYGLRADVRAVVFSAILHDRTGKWRITR